MAQALTQVTLAPIVLAQTGPAEADRMTEEVGYEENGGGGGGLPQLNTETYGSQLFWLAISFGLLFVLMSKVALPRIATVLEERRDRIQDDLDKASELKAESDSAMAAYEQALTDARGRAHQIAQSTRDEVKAEIDKLQKETDAKLDARLKDAEARIAETKAEALANVRGIATETAAEIVGHLLDEQATPKDMEAAVEAELKNRKSAA